MYLAIPILSINNASVISTQSTKTFQQMESVRKLAWFLEAMWNQKNLSRDSLRKDIFYVILTNEF